MHRTLIPFAVLLLLPPPAASVPSAAEQAAAVPPANPLHAPLPEAMSDLWWVPSGEMADAPRLAVYKPLADGVAAYAAGDYARALPLVRTPGLARTPLAGYAAYYVASTLSRLSRPAEARSAFHDVRQQKPGGALADAAALGEAEAAETLGDYRAAIDIYESLLDDKGTALDTVLDRLGRAAMSAGDRRKAATAYTRLYYEFPLSDAAVTAAATLEGLRDQVTGDLYRFDLGRAQILFGARRYADARAAFAALQPRASGDDRELVDLRLAESDHYLGRHAAALQALAPYRNKGARQAEARFFYAAALQSLKREDEYLAATRDLVDAFPDSSWTEEALNNLGTHYILVDEDARAADTFRELFERFPTGARAERAAWKYGWWQYKAGEFADTIRTFEKAATLFPRSDYRPSYLYWSARAHQRLGNNAESLERLQLVHHDYGNSYYGRLATDRLERRAAAVLTDVRPASVQADPAPAVPPATISLIRLLLAVGLYDDGLAELRYAQRTWGTSPPLEATIAWVYNQQGNLRRGITLMRRAYPQHLTAAGQEVPSEILEVIFPLTYWDLIRKYSTAHKLDPYLMAALIAQESTFQADVRSSANAWGLMQILPSTGRRLASALGIRRFRTSMLTNAETNIRLGTLYFARLVEQFGGAHYALASYTAGENRVVRWKAERPGLDQDEFIDDIPFPETQNYVKRILGTAEDYRLLYGKGGNGRPIPVAGKSTPAASRPAAAAPAPAKKTSPSRTSTPAKKKAPAPAKRKSTSRKTA
jgi:soluble lytic murein transglycosylase